MSDLQPKLVELDREAQIRAVVDDALRRRASGEDLTDEAICQQHASLLPELAAQLRKLRLIVQARVQSQHTSDRRDAATEETAAYVPAGRQVPRLSRSLHIRCPLCHEPLEIAADQPLEDIPCAACRGRFNLAGDDPDLKEQ